MSSHSIADIQKQVHVARRRMATKLIISSASLDTSKITAVFHSLKEDLDALFFAEKNPHLYFILAMADPRMQNVTAQFNAADHRHAKAILTGFCSQLFLRKSEITPRLLCQLMQMQEDSVQENLRNVVMLVVKRADMSSVLVDAKCSVMSIKNQFSLMLDKIAEILANVIQAAQPAQARQHPAARIARPARPKRPLSVPTPRSLAFKEASLQAAVNCFVALTLQNIMRYQDHRTSANDRLSAGKIKGKKSPGGKFTYDDKMLASSAFVTYINQPLKQRDFARLKPHVPACCDQTLKQIVANHARTELRLFQHRFFIKADLEAVHAWLDYEKDNRAHAEEVEAKGGGGLSTSRIISTEASEHAMMAVTIK